MTGSTAPFAAFEWMIAWRYLRARRAEGGVSVMTWISLIGVALAVFGISDGIRGYGSGIERPRDVAIPGLGHR